MTNEQFLEEIMWEAKEKSYYDQLLDLAKSIASENSNMSFADTIFQANYLITKKNNSKIN